MTDFVLEIIREWIILTIEGKMFLKKQNDLFGLLHYHILDVISDFVSYFANNSGGIEELLCDDCLPTLSLRA